MKHQAFFYIFPILLLAYIGLNWYAGHWIAHHLSCLKNSRAVSLVFMLVGLLSFWTMRVRDISWLGDAREIITFMGYSWMGSILIISMVFAVFSLCFFILKKCSFEIPTNIQTAITLSVAVLCLASAFYNGFRQPSFRHFTISSPKIPPTLDGYRIAHLSDLHFDSAGKMKKFRKTMSLINAEKPDIVLLTGDIIDRGTVFSEETKDFFSALEARDGVYACLGNHEYYYGLEEAIEIFAHYGINLLHNESIEISGLRITGIGDIRSEHLNEEDVSSMIGLGDDFPEIVLTHQPLYYDEIASKKALLTLSGHTHRGQIFPFHIFTRIPYPYFYGRYAIKETEFYVSSGTGSWGPRMRFLAAPEIAIITLRCQPPDIAEEDEDENNVEEEIEENENNEEENTMSN